MRRILAVGVLLISTFLFACSSTSFSVEISEEEPVLKEEPIKNGTVELERIAVGDPGYNYVASMDAYADDFYVSEDVDASHYSRIDAVYEGYIETDLKTVIVISTVEGRWGPIEFAVAIDASDETIIQFDVLSFSEQWGSFIDEDNFKNQFPGTALSYYKLNMFELGIDGNADATTTINGVYAALAQLIVMYNSDINEE